MNNWSVSEALTTSASHLDCPSSEKIYNVNVNIIQALKESPRYNVFFRALLLLPSFAYLIISGCFAAFAFVVGIVGLVPFVLTNAGNSILDYLLEESKSRAGVGYSGIAIFFLWPALTYIAGSFAMLLIGVPTLFGIADYFDYPGYLKCLRINGNTFGAVLKGLINSGIFGAIFLIIQVYILAMCAFVSLSWDLVGIALTVVPYHCYLFANVLIDLTVEMSESCRYQKNFWMIMFYPPVIYFLLLISAILLIIPVLAIIQIIA
ncbi:MAG: hypothetical protein AAGN15_24050 [Cyanobacteria bacterium J06581_3]